MGFFKNAGTNENDFFGEVENNLNNFEFNIKKAKIKLDIDLKNLGNVMMDAYRKLSSKWSLGGNKWHDMYYIARAFLNGEYYYDLKKIENIADKLDRLWASMDDKYRENWMISLVKQLDEYVVELSRGMESWEEKSFGKRDEARADDGVDLRELGLAMMNWHSGQWDPIYMVASYFVDGKDYPDLEVVERALSEITADYDKNNDYEKLKNNIDDLEQLRPDVDENLKELTFIIDGLTNYLQNKLPQDKNEAQDQEKDDEDELFEDS